MNDVEKAQVIALAQQLQNGGMNFNSFSGMGNDFSGMGNNFDAANMFDSYNNLNGTPPPTWTKEVVAGKNFTTYECQVVYEPIAGPPLPVEVTFFLNDFNNGVFLPDGSLQFSNPGGDTATIIGLTESFKSIMNRVQSGKAFKIAYTNIEPVSFAQFRQPITFIERNSFGKNESNKNTPKTYNKPHQYQLLNIDMPFDWSVDNERGFKWTINPDQVGAGVSLTFFIDQTINTSNALFNKPVLKKMGDATPFFTPPIYNPGNPPAGAPIRAILQSKGGAMPSMQHIATAMKMLGK